MKREGQETAGKTAQGKYEDILYLPHPVSRRHPQMPLQDRAAQFAPFAALTGHDEAVKETARLTDSYIELEEGQRERLDQRLSLLIKALRENPAQEPIITVTCFKPDEKKDGGAYVPVCGRVKKVDAYRRELVLKDGTALPMGNIIAMEGDVFGGAED
ncbi:MAG: YolD-like family protein [bacterium]|nr:YolD-like family protein [bacterium]MCM1376689.1 YolD-like family protein [Muribaculum sp.]